jgi:hypothetical protein
MHRHPGNDKDATLDGQVMRHDMLSIVRLIHGGKEGFDGESGGYTGD